MLLSYFRTNYGLAFTHHLLCGAFYFERKSVVFPDYCLGVEVIINMYVYYKSLIITSFEVPKGES